MDFSNRFSVLQNYIKFILKTAGDFTGRNFCSLVAQGLLEKSYKYNWFSKLFCYLNK